MSAGLRPDLLDKLTALPRPLAEITGLFMEEKGGEGNKWRDEKEGKGRAMSLNKNLGYDLQTVVLSGSSEGRA